MDGIDAWTAAVAAGIAFLTALAGGLLTRLGPWYENLRKPSWQPPDWAFGPAWTTIFTFCAISGYLAWEAAQSNGERALVLALFLSNAVINAGWSYFFFWRRRPDWARIEVAFLWLSIVAMIVGTAPISTTAALLLLPYLAWVSFAAYLNHTIVRLNPPFAPS